MLHQAGRVMVVRKKTAPPFEEEGKLGSNFPTMERVCK